MSEKLAVQSNEASSDRGKLAIMWILIAALLVAIPMMFVHPGVTIALFWLGLIILAVSMVIARMLPRSHGHA